MNERLFARLKHACPWRDNPFLCAKMAYIQTDLVGILIFQTIKSQVHCNAPAHRNVRVLLEEDRIYLSLEDNRSTSSKPYTRSIRDATPSPHEPVFPLACWSSSFFCFSNSSFCMASRCWRGFMEYPVVGGAYRAETNFSKFWPAGYG